MLKATLAPPVYLIGVEYTGKEALSTVVFNQMRTPSWQLEYRLVGANQKENSYMNFVDERFVTRSLYNELWYDTGIHEIYKLRIDSMKISFGYEPHSVYDKIRNTIHLTGFGYHSKWADEPSEFKTSFGTTDLMNTMILDLVNQTSFK